MVKMTHLKFRDVEGGSEWTVKLTPKRDTFELLALAHVRRIVYDVMPGAHGVDGPWLSATAVYADATEANVTVDFVRAGWHLWLAGDDYEELDAVPLTHVSRRRRLAAFWAQGEQPTAEQEAELEAARFAERANMDQAEARTRPGAQVRVPPTAPDAQPPAVGQAPAAATIPAALPFAVEPAVIEAFDYAQLDPLFAPRTSDVLVEMPPRPRLPDLPPAVVAAVHDCLRHLAGANELGHDQGFVRAQATKEALTSDQARLCRRILTRHRDLLSEELAALAMGEVDPDLAAAMLDTVAVAEHAGPAAKRARGRPPKGAAAMTPAERNKAWRASKSMASLEVPGPLLDRLLASRDAHGLSTADLLTAALDALDREQAVRLAA